jgi:hypothetical protein
MGESAENQAECRQICHLSESDQLKVVRLRSTILFWFTVNAATVSSPPMALGTSAGSSTAR